MSSAPAAAAEVKNVSEVKTSSAVKPTENLRTFHPPIEPYDKGFLPVDDGKHKLYYEQSGNPKGKPLVILHGGPGGGSVPFYRQYANAKVYRIIQFDQRGAGQSLPSASLENNTTWHLVEDIETLRKHLEIESWVVFGGSWGSTLALAYAETYPKRVKALVLRGIFTLRRKELLWFYQEGASFLFPDAWEEFVRPIPLAERGDFMSAFYRKLTSSDEKEKLEAATAWSVWEMTTSRLYIDPQTISRAKDDAKFAIAFARIEAHYFVHGGWFKYDGQLIQEAGILKDIPGTIVQGRYDVVCPAISAWDLHKAWPSSELKMVADAGHSAKEPGIVSELVLACEKYETL